MQTDSYALINLADQGLHMWDIRARALVRKFRGVSEVNMGLSYLRGH